VIQPVFSRTKPVLVLIYEFPFRLIDEPESVNVPVLLSIDDELLKVMVDEATLVAELAYHCPVLTVMVELVTVVVVKEPDD